MKPNWKDRPHPTIEMTQPYTSSVNVDRLLEKLREWEIWADSIEKELKELRKECKVALKTAKNPVRIGWDWQFGLLKEILGER